MRRFISKKKVDDVVFKDNEFVFKELEQQLFVSGFDEARIISDVVATMVRAQPKDFMDVKRYLKVRDEMKISMKLSSHGWKCDSTWLNLMTLHGLYEVTSYVSLCLLILNDAKKDINCHTPRRGLDGIRVREQMMVVRRRWCGGWCVAAVAAAVDGGDGDEVGRRGRQMLVDGKKWWVDDLGGGGWPESGWNLSGKKERRRK
ncbi:hypothetical protein Tco_0347885 [Tanacetum coccineum]